MQHHNDPVTAEPTATATHENRLLAALPPDELEAIRPELEPFSHEVRDVIYHADEPIEHVVFPCTGVISLLTLGDEARTLIEVATVGNEGFVGLPVFLGADRTAGMAISQIPGRAVRMEAEAFRQAVARSPELTALLNRYTLALFTQVAQTSFCNRIHPIEQRCARWLLMCNDRVESPEYPLTHEFLSQMLGVRRAGVSEAVGGLRDRGLIDYRRGWVQILDRDGLEAASCECYRIILDEHRRLIGTTPAAGVPA